VEGFSLFRFGGKTIVLPPKRLTINFIIRLKIHWVPKWRPIFCFGMIGFGKVFKERFVAAKIAMYFYLS
jgi:hypothetical protein